MAEKQDLGPTDVGLQANLAALLCYLPFVIGLIVSIIFFVVEKKNKFVRFNAMQAILLTVACIVIGAILAVVPVLGWALIPFFSLGVLIILIIMMIKAYQGVTVKLPIIGDIADKNS